VGLVVGGVGENEECDQCYENDGGEHGGDDVVVCYSKRISPTGRIRDRRKKTHRERDEPVQE
jgi:hypothetical protein